jgi:hypothetical protein
MRFLTTSPHKLIVRVNFGSGCRRVSGVTFDAHFFTSLIWITVPPLSLIVMVRFVSLPFLEAIISPPFFEEFLAFLVKELTGLLSNHSTLSKLKSKHL